MLQEKILQCGRRFRWLKQKGTDKHPLWLAQARADHGTQEDLRAWGGTPELALDGLLVLLKDRDIKLK